METQEQRTEEFARLVEKLDPLDLEQLYWYMVILTAKDHPQTPERVREIHRELQAGIEAHTMTDERAAELLREASFLIPKAAR